MAIHFTCFSCKKDLNEPGALIISSPRKNDFHRKLHICVDCEKELDKWLVDRSMIAMGYKRKRHE